MMKEGIYTDEELDIMQSGFAVGEDNEVEGDMNYGAWSMDDDGHVTFGTVPITEDVEKRKWEQEDGDYEGEPSKILKCEIKEEPEE